MKDLDDINDQIDPTDPFESSEMVLLPLLDKAKEILDTYMEKLADSPSTEDQKIEYCRKKFIKYATLIHKDHYSKQSQNLDLDAEAAFKEAYASYAHDNEKS